MKNIYFVINSNGVAKVIENPKAYRNAGCVVESIEPRLFIIKTLTLDFVKDDEFYRALGKSWKLNFQEDFQDNDEREAEDLIDKYIVSEEEVREGFVELDDWVYSDMA
jgi:hypothetical protein